MFLNTSLAKKNFPSDGTITTWILSDSRSATILLISSGDLFSSCLARHPLRIRSSNQLDAACLGIGQQIAPLQFGFAVDYLGLCLGLRILDGGFLPRLRLQLDCSICFCFSGSVYCMASDSPFASITFDCASPSACFAFCFASASACSSAILTCFC